MVWLDPRILTLNLLVSSHPMCHAICWYGVKGTEVDQSCFINPVKWIKGPGLSSMPLQKLTLETNINVEPSKEQK